MTVLGKLRVKNQAAMLAAALAVAFCLPAFSVGDDTPAKTKAQQKAQAKKARLEAKEKQRESAKTQDDAAPPVAPKPAPDLPGRPKKTVKPPTLTSSALDTLVEKFLLDAKAPPATQTSDVEFVRRIYLDVTGKLPTSEQTYKFVMNSDGTKRSRLIERLLSSPEYAENWARYWRDVVQYRATNENLNQVGLGEFEEWLTKEIASNRPWYEVARAMMIASGRNDQNGAVAFALAHDTQAVEIAGEVSRIFLGVQIQCAQCHDHPNDSWKRQQFHEFASFFAGMKRQRAGKGNPAVFEVVSQGKPRYMMPDLKDPTKQVPVAPKFFLASNAPTLAMNVPAEERHELAASYVTGQDNPWFARAFVNRIWYVLMGEGFYNPVDDLGPERKAKAPEVLEALATQWQQGGYDVRWLFRTILNSRAYQREVRLTLSASGRSTFAANCPSRLRADQILDSLAQVLNLPGMNDTKPGPGPSAGAGGGGQMKKQAANKKGGLVAELKDVVGKTKGAAANRGGAGRAMFNKLFGVDPSIPTDDILGTIPQALFLMNTQTVNRAIEARNGTVLGEILSATPDNRKALNAIYLRVLAREPNAKEVKVCANYLSTVNNRREAFEDILWSLINSTEFITRR